MDEDQFYSDDAMQGQEGGFGGYDSFENTPSYGQNDFMSYNNSAPQNNFNFGLGNTDYSNLDGINSLFKMNNGQDGQTDYSFPGYANYQGMSMPQGQNESTSWGDTLTKMLGGLGGLFSQQNGQRQGAGGLLNSTGLGSIIGAILTGKQNTQNAAQSKKIIDQQQASTDPFASQRPFYQQQLMQSITNPYSTPIVADQVKALKLEQDRKNAAAGRRSNSATTDPQLLRAMAEVAQKYQNSLYQPAGATFRPDMTGFKELLAANNQKTEGYISPLLSALGFNQQGNNNSANMDSTLGNLVKVLQGMQQDQEQVAA